MLLRKNVADKAVENAADRAADVEENAQQEDETKKFLQ